MGSSLLGIAVLGSLLVAYHPAAVHTLGHVVSNGSDAYILLVAITAMGLAFHLVATERPPLPIHDRQTDYIVGGALLGIGMGSTFLSAASLGPAFLAARLDLLTLPITAAGAVALVFGVRRAWTVRWAIAYLWLAWPGFARPVSEGIAAITEIVAGAAIGAWSAIVPTSPQMLAGQDGVFSVALDSRVAFVHVGPDWSGSGYLFLFALVGLGALASMDGELLGRVGRMLGVLAVAWVALLVTLQIDVVHTARAGAETAAIARQPLLAAAIMGIVLVGALGMASGRGLRMRPRRVTSSRSWPAERPSRAVMVVAAAAVILAVIHGGTFTGEPNDDPSLAAGTAPHVRAST